MEQATLDVTRQGQHRTGGRNLMSTIALFSPPSCYAPAGPAGYVLLLFLLYF